jgi:hypothetical protein
MKTNETWPNCPAQSGHLRRYDMPLTAKTGMVTTKMHKDSVDSIIPANVFELEEFLDGLLTNDSN